MTTGATIRARLRLASGLVLVAFLASHLLNHALGIVSLDALARGQVWFLAVWNEPPFAYLLYAALPTHILLTLYKLYTRRSLRMPFWEAAQLGLGLAIPLLLISHIVGTVVAYRAFGIELAYPRVLRGLWPDLAVKQLALVTVAWLHGCIGVHYWLRLKRWYPVARPALFAVALLLPVLAAFGFVDASRTAVSLPAEDVPRQASPPEREQLAAVETAAVAVFLGLVALALAARLVRAGLGRRGFARVTYPDGTSVPLQAGMSVLEASRSAGIPHAAVCGGRGRCSTCRIRVVSHEGKLPPASEGEAKVLARVGARPGVRLACQLRPVADLTVAPLLPASVGPRALHVPANPAQGVERELAVLFADLRAFTRLSEGRLPYDVVFVLNQYFAAMGTAIEEAGGRVDKFIGDGVMALFGTAADPDTAARQALIAARAMADALDGLNRQLGHDLAEPLRMGIGLHQGPVILGEMGYRGTSSLTAIGDTVNVASRLETMTKEHGVQCVVAAALAERVGCDLESFPLAEVPLRGRSRPLRVRLVDDARRMPAPAPAADPDPRRWRGLQQLLGRPKPAA